MATSRALNPNLVFSNACSSFMLTVSLYCFSTRGCLGTGIGSPGKWSQRQIWQFKELLTTLSGTWWESWDHLCRARNWSWMILVDPFQFRVLYDAINTSYSNFFNWDPRNIRRPEISETCPLWPVLGGSVPIARGHGSILHIHCNAWWLEKCFQLIALISSFSSQLSNIFVFKSGFAPYHAQSPFPPAVLEAVKSKWWISDIFIIMAAECSAVLMLFLVVESRRRSWDGRPNDRIPE